MKLKVRLFSLALLYALSGCSSQKPIDLVKENFDFASKQLQFAFTEIDTVKSKLTDEQKAKIQVSPRNVQPDGSLRLVSSRDWTSGFFPGELWYMYEYTQDSYWKQKAEEFTMPIEREKSNAGTHDMGFKIYCSFGNAYRLTQNESYKNILLEAAQTLTTRYKEKTGCIRSWDHGKDKWMCPVIIDNMMNLELLYWAFKESGDSLYYNIAVSHARTTMKNHFRPDFSTYHVIDYDTLTGTVLNKHTHQGYAHASTWSRGEAWGLYGYTMCYRETKLPEFLEQAKQIANYIFSSQTLPEDLIPYWDYNAPNIPNEPKDVSAATVTACALYELCMYDTARAKQYKQWADTILENLTNYYRATLEDDRGFLLLHSTGAASSNSEVDVPIVYADYYYLEALLKKAKLEKTGSAIL